MSVKKKVNTTEPTHPNQPIVVDSHGVKRFKENKIVRFLLDNGPFNMNSIAMQEYSQEDREQFAQLIGYSVGGYSDLSYVSNERYETAAQEDPKTSDYEKRIAYLKDKLESVQENLRKGVAELYDIHPEDLKERH